MDVERVQKINSMALELMKQGLAQDKEDAVTQAERIFARKDYSSLKETMGENKGTGVDKSAGEKEELSKDSINEILEKNSAFMVKKMKEYQEQIESLKGQVSALKSEVGQIKDKFDGMKRSIREIPTEPQRRLEPKESPNSNSNHPRSGNYTDKDVSIEKFFYAGNKK